MRRGEGSLHMWLEEEEGGRDKRSLHRVVVVAVGGGGGLPAHVAGGGGGRKGQEVPALSGCCGCMRRGEGSLHMWLEEEEGGRDKRSLHLVIVAV